MSVEDKYENLKIYCAGLEATLKQRKIRIEELERQLDKKMKSERAEAMKSKAYKQGWKDCAGHMMETTRIAAVELNKIRKDAFDLYLRGDSK